MLELFRSPLRATVWFVEASLISLLSIAVAGATLGFGGALPHEHLLRALVICSVTQASMYYHGLYDPRPMERPAFARALLRALVAAAVVLWLASRLVPGPAGLRAVAVASLGAAAVVLPAWRAVWLRLERSRIFRRPTLILGGGPLAHACAAHLAAERATGLELVGAVTADGEEGPPGAPRLGGYGDLARIAAERGIAHVIVACEDRRGQVPVEALLELRVAGVEVEGGIAFHERITGKVFVPALRPSDLLYASAPPRPWLAKRALDVLAAAIGLLFAVPILLVAAVAIKLDSPGPVLYSQERSGERGRVFRMHKLRSMRTDAEARGARWAAEDDPRVTRVGRFLRRTRVDEIPQLWNVLVGDMSLVGPRPERPVFVEHLEREIPYFRQRLAVRPGVTGHAQVRCRYGASIEDAREKLSYDLFYLKSQSLWFDLSILVDTVKVVLLRLGSR